jgi:hypothetical protein
MDLQSLINLPTLEQVDQPYLVFREIDQNTLLKLRTPRLTYEVKSERTSKAGTWWEHTYWTTLVALYENDPCAVLVRLQIDEYKTPILRYLYPSYKAALLYLLGQDQPNVSYTNAPSTALAQAVPKLFKVGGEIKYLEGDFESNSEEEINDALGVLWTH